MLYSVVFKDLWLEEKNKDKDKDFTLEQQHWVTVKDGLLADIIGLSVSNIWHQ